MIKIIATAAIYLLTMLLAYVLKKMGLFHKEDKRVLSNLIFYVTGGGFSGLSPWAVFFCSAGMNLICILTGSLAGRKAAGRACFDLSWLGGVILFGMGLLALV